MVGFSSVDILVQNKHDALSLVRTHETVATFLCLNCVGTKCLPTHSYFELLSGWLCSKVGVASPHGPISNSPAIHTRDHEVYGQAAEAQCRKQIK